jgi:hypothetical protein
VRILATALAFSVAFSLTAIPADACGDKLLVIGRRVKRVPLAKHPASVLLYLRPGSALPAAAREMNLETTLRQAGHRVDAVEQPDRLRDELAAGRYDFVLTDLPDTGVVTRAANSAPGAPEVVPVAYKPTEAALRETRATYPVVIKAGKSLSYLSALDAAMGKRKAAGRNAD